MDESYLTALKLEAASLSETLIPICQYTRHYILEKESHQHHCENQKYVIFYYFSRYVIWRQNLKISNM
jgi:hypothetical protein